VYFVTKKVVGVFVRFFIAPLHSNYTHKIGVFGENLLSLVECRPVNDSW
jgi:hypothetical protein